MMSMGVVPLDHQPECQWTPGESNPDYLGDGIQKTESRRNPDTLASAADTQTRIQTP